MATGVNMAIAIGITINKITDRLGVPKASVVICTNSLLFYEYFVKFGTTKKKRLIIDIMALRQTYERQKMFDIR
jgi:hypothetical protein